MGGGNWTRDSFSDYTTKTKRMSLMADGSLDSRYSHQDIFKSRRLDSALDPKNVLRECCDSEEHPNTFPVILALDVTGSMGDAAAEVAKKLGIVMTELYEKVPDIEFMIMAIGDTAYDNAPIQASQFESDIRIAQQLDKVYFESGGGGNSFESYTAAWYFGIYHCVLDCWKRGKKGLIITMGDEMLNPFLDRREINHYLGDPKTCGVNGQSIPPVYNPQKNSIETSDLYEVASAYYDICHIQVEHGWHGTDRDSRQGGRESCHHLKVGQPGGMEGGTRRQERHAPGTREQTAAHYRHAHHAGAPERRPRTHCRTGRQAGQAEQCHREAGQDRRRERCRKDRPRRGPSRRNQEP